MKAICLTTIYPPSEALHRFIKIAEQDDWVIFVAGDLKTPHDLYRSLNSDHFHYLSPGQQGVTYPFLSEAIGWNCIQRRNMAFVEAYNRGAEIIASCDDDNIPKEGWGRNLLIGKHLDNVMMLESDIGVVDPLYPTSPHGIWHRGFPIQLVSERDQWRVMKSFKAEIQADLWDGDPDVDAVCRMTRRVPKKIDPQWYPSGTNHPTVFNSQNTFLLREVIPYYAMHVGVGRSDDIWAAFHAQANGFKVIFGPPSVTQERNPQDVMKNFEDELFNYRFNADIVKEIPHDPECVLKRLSDHGRRAYECYRNALV